MKPTQQEIIEQLGAAFDRAVEICGREFVAKSLLERFGAGGGEPVAWIDGTDLELMRKDGRGCIAWAQKQSNATTPLYTHPSPTDLRAEYLRGLEDAAKVCDERAQGLLSIIDLPVVSSPIIQKDRAAQWKDAATKIRELKGKQ